MAKARKDTPKRRNKKNLLKNEKRIQLNNEVLKKLLSEQK
jgi:hypothetical protein